MGILADGYNIFKDASGSNNATLPSGQTSNPDDAPKEKGGIFGGALKGYFSNLFNPQIDANIVDTQEKPDYSLVFAFLAIIAFVGLFIYGLKIVNRK